VTNKEWGEATSNRIVEMLRLIPDDRKTTDPLYLPASLFAIVLRYGRPETLDDIAAIVRISHDVSRIPPP
jgi:hypothetical protein